ncbi:hypothetical protein Clacol_005005 [Clathrus columnatus]|uniref:F-box domain-containing protein n=1 Tax=Clathrus columnatus TaxID=1419009 RepID=A0AAV5AAQ3_9AGAM|nr:hypothetical protein Clacol_005005 [Clathrus columnatus]
MQLNENVSNGAIIQMPLSEMAKKRKELSDYLNILNDRHNSLIPINKTIPDILYQIFVLAVFGSTYPGTTTLIISHVCHHWRKSALEWPILWGFWDYNSRQISELFLERSRDAPITLSWARSHFSHHPLFKRLHRAGITSKKRSNKSFFESCASLLPRLDTVIIYPPHEDFNKALPIFQSSGQLRLRSIDIGLRYTTDVVQSGINTKWFEYLSTDATYLRELAIRGLSLPWTIPPHQKLTRLLIKAPSPLPTPISLLTFLSHCPALDELDISLSLNSHTHDVPFTNLPAITFQKLNFPYLTSLRLHATDARSYECIREVSSRIVISRQLSSLSITYLPRLGVPSTLKLFELAPTGSWGCFKNQPFFSINLPLPGSLFHIHAGSDPNCLPRGWRPGGSHRNNNHLTKRFPFSLVGRAEEPFDHSPVIDLLRGMSNIQHLQLISSAWELLTSWNVDFPALFPHLTTLELCDQYLPVGDCTNCLMALTSFSGTIIHALILRGVSINSTVLLDVASKIRLRTLELEETHIESEILTILREKGVEVIVIDDEWYKECFATPFAYLPPDILFIVAGFVEPDVQNNPDPKRHFLPLTGVCRHWRSAFLSCPSFWTRIQIPERSTWYLEEMLIRSAEYPLKVMVHYFPKYPASTIAQHSNILLPHLHRIQSLVIYQNREPIPNSILSLISKPVPMLEIFRYECQRISFRRLVSNAEGSIPVNLFADHAPRLKEFHASRVKLYHNLPIFKTITRLSLKRCHGLTHYRLLDILETVSLNLQFLEISSPPDYIWPAHTSDTNNHLVILLSSLRTLVLRAGLQVSLFILSHTDIPSDVDWEIDFDELIPNVSLDITPFVSFLTKARKGPHAFFKVCEEYLCIKFKQTRSGPHNSALELDIKVDPDDAELRRLEFILGSLELSNVLSCELVCPMNFPPWMTMYGRMSQPFFSFLDRLEMLSFACNNSDQLEIFICCLQPRYAQATITIPCPSLNVLKLNIVAGSLIQGLAARREAGHVLKKLCVEYENPLGLESYTTLKQELMKLVQNVEMIEKVILTRDSFNTFLT